MGFTVWSRFSFMNPKKFIFGKKKKKVFAKIIVIRKFFKNSFIHHLKTKLKSNRADFNFFFKNIPLNYNFEFEKTVKKLNSIETRKIFMQLPDGLQKFFFILSNFFFSHGIFLKNIFISNQTTFGACCVDDLLSKASGVDTCIHYGHSCLVPIIHCFVPVFYVFLEVYFDQSYFIELLKKKFFRKERSWNILSTVQFISCLKRIQNDLLVIFENVAIPQNKPLSPGEVLGCTSPIFDNFKNIIYFGDGRFHLESGMLSSPNSRFFNYNPFSHSFFISDFSIKEFSRERGYILFKAFFRKRNIGIIFGTLGRQGSIRIFRVLQEILEIKNLHFLSISSSEILPITLEFLDSKKSTVWTQIACPRLSFDWGKYFKFPLISSSELLFLLGFSCWTRLNYFVDYFSEKGGFWSTNSNYSSSFFFK